MNSIRIKSGIREVEIVTDQPCSPKEMVEAAENVLQMTSLDTAIIESPRPLALPEVIKENKNIIQMEAKVIKPEKRKPVGSGEEAQAKNVIGELISEGKFDNAELNAGDVRKLLSELAYNFEDWAISKALAHYVRERQLIRTGTRLKYKYSRRTDSKKLQSLSQDAAAQQVDQLVA